MGASAIPQSVDFRAFEVNVKTIAPKKNCINLDTQYGVRGRKFLNERNFLLLDYDGVLMMCLLCCGWIIKD